MARSRNKRKVKKIGLGFSPVHATASAAGTHGGGKRARNRRDRARQKQELRSYWR